MQFLTVVQNDFLNAKIRKAILNPPLTNIFQLLNFGNLAIVDGKYFIFFLRFNKGKSCELAEGGEGAGLWGEMKAGEFNNLSAKTA